MNDTKTPRTDAEAAQSCDTSLRSAFVVHVEFARELEREIARLRAERDEARRMACEALAAGDDEEAAEYARLRGWDCFAHTEGAPEVEP